MSETQEEQEFQLPTPGPEHELLKPFEGTFSSVVKIWMGPGDPVESTGTITNTFQLNGLYLHQNYFGDNPDGPFPNFAGKGYWGYNQHTKKYEGFWIDVASTMMQMESGECDSDGKVWEMASGFTHPATGQPVKKRTVITLIDQDHHSMESYFSSEGQPEFKNMEINYTRKG